MQTRRQAAIALAAGAIGYGFGIVLRRANAATNALDGLGADLAAIEKESGGRLGVAVLDTASRAFGGHRADERFPMCSTFKLLAAAAVLKRVERGEEKLNRRVIVQASDIVVNSPATKERIGDDGVTM